VHAKSHKLNTRRLCSEIISNKHLQNKILHKVPPSKGLGHSLLRITCYFISYTFTKPIVRAPIIGIQYIIIMYVTDGVNRNYVKKMKYPYDNVSIPMYIRCKHICKVYSQPHYYNIIIGTARRLRE